MATARRGSDSDCSDESGNDSAAETKQDITKRGGPRKPGVANVTTPLKKEAIEGLKRSPTTLPFKTFWAEFEPFVRAICRDKDLYAQEEEDVVADAKLAVLNSIKTYRKNKGAFHSWLGTITNHKIMDVLRRRIPYEKKHVQVDNDDKLQWLIGQPNVSSETTRRGDVKDTTKPAAKDASRLVSDTAMAGLHGGVRKHATPATLACVAEEREIAKSVLERVSARVTPKQWQIFEAVSVRNLAVSKVCKALKVTENQVYIARNRVGKVYNEELEAMGRTIGRDLQQYKLSKPEPPRAASKPKTSTSANRGEP